MAERQLKRGFRDLQEIHLKNARDLTLNPEESERYACLDTGLEKYEKDLLEGNRLMDFVEQAFNKDKKDQPVRILDYGCGHNVALRELVADNNNPEIKIEATGVSAGDPRTLEEKEVDESCNIKFIDQTGIFLKLPINTYDIIISRFAFFHLPNPLETLRTLYKSLKIGGIMRIHLRTYTGAGLADKFFNDKVSQEDASKIEDRLINDLKKSGIDLELNGRILSVKKNDVNMRFPNVGLSTSFTDGLKKTGVYVYKD